MSNTEKEAFLEFMAEGNNVANAAVIARQWNEVRYHTEWRFWDELVRTASAEYQLKSSALDDEDPIYEMVWEKRNARPWYGITFCVADLDGIPLLFKIERGWENIYYGVMGREHTPEQRQRMSDALQHLHGATNDMWVTHKAPADDIAFGSFNRSQYTQNLLNKGFRQKAVAKLWVEIRDFITRAHEALTSEFGPAYKPVQPEAHFVVA